MVDIEIEVPTVDIVLADQLSLIGLLDGGFEHFTLTDIFTANIDVTSIGLHGEAGNQAALDQQVRIMAHDLAVLAGAGLGLVGIDHQIVRAILDLFGHERPFQAGAEARPTAPA